jgi:PhzF family phenazine biosynthesis protein
VELRIFQVDAFTSKVFAGNPAAVVPLERWLPDATLQAIGEENNLSETAFIVPEGDGYRIRWFTPTTEVELCGHATLATAYVLFNHLLPNRNQQEIRFASLMGPLSVTRDGDRLALNFPAMPPKPSEVTPQQMERALGKTPRAVMLGSLDYLVIFEREEDIRSLAPDFDAMRALPGKRGVITTAPGKQSHFVSRYFAPAYGIPEDPVTGSSHCTMTPYWAEKLGTTRLHAFQLSKRGGELFCELRGDRVSIAGNAVKYLEGTITVP